VKYVPAVHVKYPAKAGCDEDLIKFTRKVKTGVKGNDILIMQEAKA
jgi:hypothetical protein